MQNLSTKELNYLNDLLSWELLAAKKCFQYANQEISQVQSQVFFDTARLHQQNYVNLFNYVDQINQSQGGQTH